MKNIIQVENVRKKFEKEGEIRILEDINLQVQKTEILLLLGPNGVGKTILLCCIAGGLFPSQGKISVFGYSPSSQEAHKRISFLLEDFMALNYLTGKENIRHYLKLHEKSTDKWKKLVKILKIEKDLNRLVKDYSGGMKRKLELTTALSLDTPLYLLDEPTAGLDLSSIQVFHDILLKLKKEGKTIVFSTHNPLNAEIADRIAFMRESEKGGEIAIVDKPQNLLDKIPKVVKLTPFLKIPSVAKKFALGGQIYEIGEEGRCFLSTHQEINELRNKVRKENPSCKIKEIDPTYTDMFNYYSDIWRKV